MKLHEGGISIWFFIGISLLVNGILILGAGIWELFYPPANPVALFQLHASVWWGGLLLIFGLIYCAKYSPGRGASFASVRREGPTQGRQP